MVLEMLPDGFFQKEAPAGHNRRLGDIHEIENRGSHVGQFPAASQPPGRSIFKLRGYQKERDRARGVPRIDAPIRIKPSLRGSVIGGHYGYHPRPAGRLQASAQVGVHGLHRLPDGLFVFDMPHHVDVGEVGEPEMHPGVLKRPDDRIGHARGIHLRLLVELGNLFGGRHGNSLFPRKGLADFAIEKEAHMNGFLRLGDLHLLQPVPAQGFTQGVANLFFRREGHPRVEFLMVGNHGDHVQA